MVNKDDIIGQCGEKYYSNKYVSIVGSSISPTLLGGTEEGGS